jgi:hypothetical protein
MQLVKILREFLSHLRFILPLKKVRIEELQTDFSLEVIDFICSNIGFGSNYFEFGAGASTIISERMGAETFSTETDQRYIDALKSLNHIQFVNPLCGKVGPWGGLIFEPWRKKKRSTGFRYATIMWQRYSGFKPNLVLIDGRYRLACALEIVRRFPGGNFPVIIDDYVGRNEYKTIEKYVDRVTQMGRAGVFYPNKIELNMEELRLDLEKAFFDSR